MVRISEAAVKLKNGIVIHGMRHGSILHNLVKLEVPRDLVLGAIQGFVDNKGVFYTREEALKLVQSNGQLNVPIIGGVLTSEDLW